MKSWSDLGGGTFIGSVSYQPTVQECLKMAYDLATSSPDQSTQNGSVIPIEQVDGSYLLLGGCNNFPRGVKITPERMVRPLKYFYIEHAERNAILLAAYTGYGLAGRTMFVPWFACADCARAIIVSGITRVIGHKKMYDETPERWKESINQAFEMMHDAGVETQLIEEVPNAPQIRFNEKLWQP